MLGMNQPFLPCSGELAAEHTTPPLSPERVSSALTAGRRATRETPTMLESFSVGPRTRLGLLTHLSWEAGAANVSNRRSKPLLFGTTSCGGAYLLIYLLFSSVCGLLCTVKTSGLLSAVHK